MINQPTSQVPIEIEPNSIEIRPLDNGQVLITMSTELEPWAARRIGRNLQLLADLAEEKKEGV